MNWLLALIPIMFTYSGWNAASYISEELHDTRRMIGPALLIGTSIVVGLYFLLNTLYLYAIPPAAMQGAVNVGDVTAHALFGVGRNFVTPALIIALLGAVSAMTIAGPRVYFAMARDRAFVPGFDRTSPTIRYARARHRAAGFVVRGAGDGRRLLSAADVHRLYDSAVVRRSGGGTVRSAAT